MELSIKFLIATIGCCLVFSVAAQPTDGDVIRLRRGLFDGGKLGGPDFPNIVLVGLVDRPVPTPVAVPRPSYQPSYAPPPMPYPPQQPMAYPPQQPMPYQPQQQMPYQQPQMPYQAQQPYQQPQQQQQQMPYQAAAANNLAQSGMMDMSANFPTSMKLSDLQSAQMNSIDDASSSQSTDHAA